jgi:glutathione S-transferase
MILYGHPGSTCTRKVLCTLYEKRAEFDYVVVDITKGEQKSPEHLARQPFGVVPAIDDNGFTLYESRAIIRYLDQKLPGEALTPESIQLRAFMEQWISVETSYFTPPAMKAIMNIWYASMSGASPDQSVIDAGLVGAAKALDVLEKSLPANGYLVSDFSLADICYAPYLQYLEDMKIDAIITDRPKVAAWWNRIKARPSWQKAIGR